MTTNTNAAPTLHDRVMEVITDVWDRQLQIDEATATVIDLCEASTAAQPPAGIWVPTELAERVQETMGEFLMDHGWRQQDMNTSDEFGALLAVATKVKPAPPDYVDAYQGAREDLAIWKRRALEAESALRTEQEASSRLAAEVNEANGPTHLGEPAQPERVPLTWEQIYECLPLGVAGYSALIGVDEIRAFVRAIEQVHGIKPTKEES